MSTIRSDRHKLLNHVRTLKELPQIAVERIERLHFLRKRLVEEKLPPEVEDAEVEQIRNSVQLVLRKLFGIRFPER